MDELSLLKKKVMNEALKFNQGINPDGGPCSWIFDFREFLLKPDNALLVSKLLYNKILTLKSKQVGGMTLCADPIISNLVLYSEDKEKKLQGFIIRKERKKAGLQKKIEGKFSKGEPAIIVDDLVNSGKSIFKAIDEIKKRGSKVESIISILDFNRKGKKLLNEKKYNYEYLITFRDIIKSANFNNVSPSDIKWSLDNINKWDVNVPRSNPAYIDNKIVFGTNEGKVFCQDVNNGNKIWEKSYNINNPKGILSSPCIIDNKVLFGAYNGYLYCLDLNSGDEIWSKKRGDWIGSSPCVNNGIVYVGVEYGKKGGVVIACSVENGKLLWYHKTNHYIHSSPCVDKYNNIVIIGCNDGYVYALGNYSGKLLWKYDVGKEIKAGFVIDKGKVYFGAFDGYCYCFNILNGNLIWRRKLSNIIYSTPEIVGEEVIISVVSSRIFALNKENGEINRIFMTKGNIFSYTDTIEGSLYCGCCDGYLYEIDLKSFGINKLYNIKKEILTKPLIVNNNIIIGCKGGISALSHFNNKQKL